MSIAILGAEGQLGSEFVRQLREQGKRYHSYPRAHADLCNRTQLREALSAFHDLDTVINCAAYTKVDLAEQERDLCRAVNVDGVHNVADYCDEHGLLLVQISTDYVFGQAVAEPKPWRESDPVQTQSVYAQSKLEGEHVAAKSARHLIVRTCGLYGRLPKPVPGKHHPGNFVETIIRLGRERPLLRVVNDQRCTPSYIGDIVEGILMMVDHEERHDDFLSFSTPTHLVHLVNRGDTTWYEFAKEIFRLSKIETPIEPITTADFAARAPRPSYSVLDCSFFDRFGKAIGMPKRRTWQEALAEYLRNRK
jgi:dTDP-4-dehydrorhamnose reductase